MLNRSEAASLLDRFSALVAEFTEPQSDGRNEPLPAVRSVGGYVLTGTEILPAGFDHLWPNAESVTQYRPVGGIPTVRYTARTADGHYSLLIGAELGGRTTHGRVGRGRIVVFVQRAAGTEGLYPLVEFAETDITGAGEAPLYAAGVPRITAPRSLSTEADLPELAAVTHLRGADLRRADQVYNGMRSGPSLRLVVHPSDADAMLAHALWVGELRGGGRLPRPA